MQNSRFALGLLERELRMAGVGVADAQPLLVMAGPTSAVTFNADLVALDTGDYSAVYINPDADSAGVDLMRTSAKITLPGTTKQYPDTNYMYNIGVPSNAETITYWLSRDSTSSQERRVHPVPPRERAAAEGRRARHHLQVPTRHRLPVLEGRHVGMF